MSSTIQKKKKKDSVVDMLTSLLLFHYTDAGSFFLSLGGNYSFTFNVKFYPPDPAQLSEDITRYCIGSPGLCRLHPANMNLSRRGKDV